MEPKNISFSKKLVVSFKQNRCIAQNALVLGDIDNDPNGVCNFLQPR